MLKIAFCDDNPTDRNKVAEAIAYVEEECDQKFDVTEFSTGKALCDSVKSQYYDVILLDILMGQMDGIKTASTIRATGQNFVLIFISSYEKKMRELFQFNTSAFLDKPLDKELLLTEFQKILHSDVIKPKPILAFTSNRQKMYVNFRKIYMVESCNHKVIIHTCEGEYVASEKLKNIWEHLKTSKDFVFPNRTTIINMCFSSMDSKTMFTVPILQKTVIVGRTKKDSTIERYLKFVEG